MGISDEKGVVAGPDQEAVWIREIAAGSRDAFEQLYHAYQARLFRYLFRCMGDTPAAEELVNDVMVAVWKGAKEFKGHSKPSTWIFGIAHHKVMNAVRRKNPETVELEAESEVMDSQQGPDEVLIHQSLKDKIKQALQALSPAHRAVIELTFYHEFSYQEVAEIVNCPVNTVKTRLFYAKKQLHTILEQTGMRGEME